MKGAEHCRLEEDRKRAANWKRWGPYLSDRQWSTVREDYSAQGDSWRDFPHDHARSRAYRWGEDGLLGICDRQCRVCFAPTFWNGRDPILKERLFGLTGPEGNHGEDVKECYYHLDATPTHSYLKALYKYPQAEFPYAELVDRNAKAGLSSPEIELEDLGMFDEGRYFDIAVEYAKASPQDLLIRLTVTNQGPDEAELHVLPTIWFRNTWSWGCKHEGCSLRPSMRLRDDGVVALTACGPEDDPGRVLEPHVFEVESIPGATMEWLFTDNETNSEKLFGTPNDSPWVKDAFHRRVVDNEVGAVNPARCGTKAAPWFRLNVGAGESVTLHMRLAGAKTNAGMNFGPAFHATFALRQKEADEFYAEILSGISGERGAVARKAYAGLLWSCQFYHYIVLDWLRGDPSQPEPPPSRFAGRNKGWQHLYARDVLSMPDKWEYPWFAAWDLAFHMLPMADIDPGFAKAQLALLLREWYLHPNGQIPAYEFKFDDVNPPVHAWAARRVYEIERAATGQGDRDFLAGVFQKLLLNFTWWVNRKDAEGRNLFTGGFLGLDNIGVFDRSRPLPGGGRLEQADATAWMAFYCANMLDMAIELASTGPDGLDPAYEDMASKFFEHFIQIVDAANALGGCGLWNEDDGFYFDEIRKPGGEPSVLRFFSMVGLLPLIALGFLDEERIASLPGFKKRLEWFLRHRGDLAGHITYCERGCPEFGRRLLAFPSKDKLERLFARLFDEEEFLAPFGIRSLSKKHGQEPFRLHAEGRDHLVRYLPAESDSLMFGGNSNWRGPVWFPVNYLLIEALDRYHEFFGSDFTVEFPSRSGNRVTLSEAADNISRRLVSLFLPDEKGRRPCHGNSKVYAANPAWRDLISYYEYFHPETGRGCGASHQTGWTALVARLVKRVLASSIIS